MAETTTEELGAIASQIFESKFGPSAGCAVVFAPGRVNLIGEHTDYNGGFVMPLALRMKTVAVGRGKLVPRKGASAAGRPECRIVSSASTDVVTFTADENLRPGEIEWANYVKGVVAAYMKDVPTGYCLAFDAAIASSVPIGGGLSSSAALEVSVATLLEEIMMVEVSRVEKALRCQWADHNFLNVPCGIMDQFVSALAQARSTLLVDCRSRSFEAVPLDDDEVVFVVANSGVAHRNAGGAYAERVQQCKDAVQAIKKRHPTVQELRDASVELVNEIADEVDEKVFKRARHVVTEDRRTLCCAMALRRRDYSIVGGCMTESHASLRDDYEVSISELDELVSIALKVEGVYGSRMTGGGFGGCTVTLVKREAAARLLVTLREEYMKRTGNVCEGFVTSPCDGAGVLVPLRRPLRLRKVAAHIAAALAVATLGAACVAICRRNSGRIQAHVHVR